MSVEFNTEVVILNVGRWEDAVVRNRLTDPKNVKCVTPGCNWRDALYY